jgi:DNA primase
MSRTEFFFLQQVELQNVTILTVPDILKRHADPWKDILGEGQDLAKILDSLSTTK